MLTLRNSSSTSPSSPRKCTSSPPLCNTPGTTATEQRWDRSPRLGGPLPQDRWGEKTRTSHIYTQTGDFQVVLTTHFQGTYSVNNGPPLPIPGQGQFNAPPQTISVWRSVTRNYADDCIRNPQGQGCPGVAPPVP